MKKIKIGLLPRIIIAIILGIAIGQLFHSTDYRRTGHCGYCRHW